MIYQIEIDDIFCLKCLGCSKTNEKMQNKLVIHPNQHVLLQSNPL